MGRLFGSRSNAPGPLRSRDQPDWTDAPEIRLAPDVVGSRPVRPRRGNGRAIGLVAVIVVAAIVVGLTRQHHAHRSAVAPATVTAAPVAEATGAPRGTDRPLFSSNSASQSRSSNGVLSDPGIGIALQVDAVGQVYVLSAKPPQLTLTGSTGIIVRGARLPDGVSLMALDGDRPYLWLVSVGETSTVQLYDAPTVTAAGAPVMVQDRINQVLAVNGVLWLAGSGGLYKLAPNTAAARVAGLAGFITAIAYDGAGGRLIVAIGSEAGSDLIALDPSTGTILARGHVPLVGVTLASVQDHLWVAGFGNPDGGGQLALLNPITLRTGRTAPAALGVDAGAQVWPGGSVLWAYTTGDGLMSCLAPATGAVLAQWSDLRGPVASTPGVLTAIAADSVRLLSPTAGCTG